MSFLSLKYSSYQYNHYDYKGKHQKWCGEQFVCHSGYERWDRVDISTRGFSLGVLHNIPDFELIAKSIGDNNDFIRQCRYA